MINLSKQENNYGNKIIRATWYYIQPAGIYTCSQAFLAALNNSSHLDSFFHSPHLLTGKDEKNVTEQLTRDMHPICRANRKSVEKIKLRNAQGILKLLKMFDNSISESKYYEKEAFNNFKLNKKGVVSYW